jgi:flagellar biosynthesis GTPase FlhF
MTMVDLTPVEEAQIQHGPYGDLPRLIYEVRSQPQVDAAVGRTGWGVGRLPRRSIVFVISAAAATTSIIIYFGMIGVTSREFMPIREAIDEDATAELQQERKKTAALTNELIAARRDYLQTIAALSNKGGDETAPLRKTAEAATAALEDEQKKTAALTSELAAARRDLETKAAQSSKAGDETAQLRKTADAATAALEEERKKTAALMPNGHCRMQPASRQARLRVAYTGGA